MRRRLLFTILVPLTACNALLGIEDLGGPPDEDAATDAPPGPPGITHLRSPRIGATTGTVHAVASLRPRFSWRATAEANRYELVVDDSCQTSSFRSCLFPSPEIMESDLVDVAFTPSINLAVNLSAPVGRRYFWRVRGCNELGCGEWSEVWYLDVGRLADDVNGDGYGDLVIGTQTAAGAAVEIGAAYIAFGRSGQATITTTKLPDPRNETDGRFGMAVAMVGDVNADGYGDLVVGAWRTPNNNQLGTAYLYLGRGTWPATVATATTAFGLTTSDASAGLGGQAAGRGDMNGDGYGDFAISAVPALFGGPFSPPTFPGHTYVYFGRSAWSLGQLGADLVIPDPEGDVTGLHGAGLAFADIGEDGRSDLIVGAPGAFSSIGASRVYHGQTSFPAAPHTIGTADVTFTSPATGQAFFGNSAAACGGHAEGPAIVIGAPLESRPVAGAGVMRVYLPRSPWPATVADPETTLPDPAGTISASMGAGVRCGDVDADGRDDMVVGAPSVDTGAVYVYAGIAGLPGAPMTSLTSGNPSIGILGTAVAVTDFDGDGVADVFGGAPNLGGMQQGQVLGWLGRAQWSTSGIPPDITIANPDGTAELRFGRKLD